MSDYHSQQTWDYLTDNFYSRMNRGEIMNNPFESRKRLYTEGRAHIDRNCFRQEGTPPNVYTSGITQNGTMASSFYLGTPMPSPWPGKYYAPSSNLNTSNLIDQAVQQAWANIDSSEIAGLVTLAEMPKTVASLVGLYKRVFKVFNAVKKKRLKYLLRRITYDDFLDAYMEARYALRPMAYDVRDLARALTARASNQSIRQTYRGYAEDYEEDTLENQILYHNLSSYKVRGNKFYSRKFSVRAGVLTAIEGVSTLQIYGLNQPIEALWEMTHLSFALDWFIDVGQAIAALTPEYGTNPLTSWYTFKDQRVFRNYVTHVDTSESDEQWNLRNDFTLDGMFIQHNYEQTKRVPNPNRPILPIFKVKLNPFKIIDLGIIIKNLLNIKFSKAIIKAR
jgi:hypothetical protein